MSCHVTSLRRPHSQIHLHKYGLGRATSGCVADDGVSTVGEPGEVDRALFSDKGKG